MNPRRQLKTLETLARARDMALTDLKRDAAIAVDRLARTESAMADVRAAVSQESADVGNDPIMLTALTYFTSHARGKLLQLDAARESLIADVELADARVLEAYQSLKQIEQAADTRRREIDDEIARKERAVADDLAAIRATRNRD
ncbi:MAG: hypothetical protein ACKVH0_19385 [Alphaproteobacteria bacterium]